MWGIAPTSNRKKNLYQSAMSHFVRGSAGSRSLLCHFGRMSSLYAWASRCHEACPRHSESWASFSRWLHCTSVRKGAASKLKESPMDGPDDIDTTKPADYNPSNFDPTESRSAPSEKILKIVDEIANLTLLEASDLSYLLKKKLGLPDSAMPYYGGSMGPGMAMQQAGGGGAPAEEEKKPEKTSFDVKLEKFEAAAKIKVIKEVRAFTTLGLKEAKELVEKLPAMLKTGVGKEEAEKLIEKLKAVGATAVME